MNTQKQRLQLGVQLSIWLVIILGYALVFTRFLPIEASLVRSLGNILPIIVLFYGNKKLVASFFIPKRYLSYLIGVSILFLLITFLRTQINIRFIDYKLDFLPQTNQKFIRWAAILSNAAVILVSIIYQLLIHRSKEEEKALLAINEHQLAQLQFLRSQIHPHFLFNTLNNIYSLAVTRSEQTAPMVLHLSELLRYVVYDGQAEKVSLQNEAQQIERFITLFQMRQEDPVHVQFKTNEIPEDGKIEPMILIPLVENCFKHCDFDSNEDALVKIDLQVSDQALSFSTFNTKNQHDLQKDTTGGVGLKNIEKRLALKYAGRHRLQIEETDSSFSVQLHIKL